MNLPAAGPIKLWTKRDLIRKSDIIEPAGMQAFMVRVYNDLYSKKIRTLTRELRETLSEEDGERLYATLCTSVKRCDGIAPRTKDAFWTAERMRAHVRNTLWTLSYWTLVHHFPDPLDGDHGFERRGNFVAFSGTDPAAAPEDAMETEAPDDTDN